jgi:hypothetical protein
MHPILITALAEDRRRRCPCGAVAQQRYGLCRECQVAAGWRPETARTRNHAISSWTRARTALVRFSARVASVIRLSSQKAES